MNKIKSKSKSLPWDEVEKAIDQEIKWLQDTIIDSPFQKNEICIRCTFRTIAIRILSGKIKAKDIKSPASLFGRKKNFNLGKPHGKDEHFELMKLLATYFHSEGYQIDIEPRLNMGRADLGVYKNGRRDLFIEVGTISIPKLLFNLQTMKDSDILLVLDANHAVEFSVLETHRKYYPLSEKKI